MARATWTIGWLIAACGSNSSHPALVTSADAGANAGDNTCDDAGMPGSDGDASVESIDLAVICGGKEPVTFDDWEDCFQRRRCEWQVGCQSLNTFRDVEECMASADAASGGRLAEERRARRRAVDQGRARIDRAAFARCLSRTDAIHCNTALYDPACLTRFTGTIADGEVCYTDIDCRSRDATCSANCSNDACCSGACTPKRKEGQSCTTFRSCEPGLNCNGICIAGDIDTPCSDSGDCDPEAWCDFRTYRCKPTLPVGAECTSILQCGDDTTCIGLSIVHANPGHCERSSRSGDPCDDAVGCYGHLYCARSPNTALGQCRELPELGESCSALVPCAGVATLCSSGRCALRSEAGVACSAQTCLPGLFCTSALGDPAPRCAARRATNMPCNDPGQCESYLCSGNPGVCLEWRELCP